MAQLAKNLPAMQKTWVLSLGWEDPMEKVKATHSSILENSLGLQGVGHDWVTFTFTHTILHKGLEVPQILLLVWVGGVLEQVPGGFWGKIVLKVFHIPDTRFVNKTVMTGFKKVTVLMVDFIPLKDIRNLN